METKHLFNWLSERTRTLLSTETPCRGPGGSAAPAVDGVSAGSAGCSCNKRAHQ